MSKPPEFLILKQPLGWISETRWTEVLGSVVLNPHSPLDNSTPDHPPLELNDISEISFPNFILHRDLITDSSTSFNIQGLGSFRRQRDDTTHLNLHGKLVIARRLTKRRSFWKIMADADPEFAEQVAEWVGERHGFLGRRARYEVCWVVGLLVCKDVAIAASVEQKKECRARGDIPLGTVAQMAAAAHGATIPIGGMGNTSVEGRSAEAEHEYFVAKADGGYIFALEVVLVNSAKGKTQPTDEAPKGQKLGHGGDVDNEVFPEDLELKEELDGEDWDNLLQ
ncbi:hypothetical protein GQ53DRAFT_844794 [Thozetella sp. PMI_491]|nr:hypothetical protein GQ53DRAFT_844794 [Thozetella sp. PMI_491]